jgi:hypothetical protein
VLNDADTTATIWDFLHKIGWDAPAGWYLMKLREIYRSPNYYSVCETDQTEGLVLYVVAGGIAMYSVVVKLLPEEIAEFESQGHLDDFAREVCRNESRFQGRILKPGRKDERLEFVDAF